MRRALTWFAAFLLASGIGFGGLIAVGCAVDANICPFGGESKLTTTDGREIFQARCALCHGRAGEGGKGPSLLTERVASLSLPELRRKVEKGRPFYGMPAFGLGPDALSDEQLTAVARYVMQLRGGPNE